MAEEKSVAGRSAERAASPEALSPAARRWRDGGRFLEIGGRRLFVRDEGEGPCVLFLHGFPTSCFDWRKVVARLAGRFRCVSFDFPGFGLSDKPAAYSYSLFQQTDHIEALADRLGIAGAHVVSHDMGTSAHAELLAREQEGRVRFAVESSTFLNGSLLKAQAKLVDLQRMLEDPQRLREALEVCRTMLPAYVPALKKLMARPECLSDEDAEVMTELLRYQEGHLRLPHVYAYVRERYLHTERWLGAIAAARGPVQLLWGTQDPIATVAMGRALRTRLPRARYVELPGVGHFVPLEAPEAVADAVAAIAAGG